jgi:hypothetical protein
MKKFWGAVAALYLVAALQLAGCGTVERHETTAKLAVTYATLKGVEKGLDPARTRAVAERAKAIVAGDAVTLVGLQEAISTELAGLELSPADRMLAGILVSAIAQELQLRIGVGVLSAEQKVKVGEVLQWVIDATYLGAPAT